MNPLILIGPSGSGKTILAKVLEQRGFGKVYRSHTTRQPRNKDDDSHIFISDEEFNDLEKNDKFIIKLEIFNAKYGLKKEDYSSERPIFLARLPVVKQARFIWPDAIIIHIEARINILVQRLKARGSYDRLDRALLGKEIEQGRTAADLVVDNSSSIEAAIATIENAL